MKVPERLAHQADLLPDGPGVYVFRDAAGEALYVGKAVSLRKRVRSHFQRPADDRIRLMLEKAAAIEHFVVSDETEALLLEYNLIKSLKPRYNVSYRDDKSYPYIALTVGEEWPRLFLTRRLDSVRARYFGPYPSALAARRTLEALRRLFPLRDCRSPKLEKHGRRPCLSYEIKRCAGPCVGAVSRDEYARWVREIESFLEGRNDRLLRVLEEGMRRAAAELRFEEAAAYRDKLQAAQYVIAGQRVVVERRVDLDVYGYFAAGDEIYVKVMFVRGGRVVGARGFVFDTASPEEALREAMGVLAARGEHGREAALPAPVGFEPDEALSIRATVPKRGWKRDLVELAMDNARQSYYWYRFQAKAAHERTGRLLEEARDTLGLTRLPLRIECYDISTFRGRNAVGSMVVFEDGKPKKSHYRKFRIRGRPDSDVDMMREVLERRLEKLGDVTDRSFAVRPDLVVVDGGKPQLSACEQALAAHGLLGEIDVAALAKREEEIWRPGERRPLRLPRSSEVLKLFMRIRDETHRFAITYHRGLELKAVDESVLARVRGVGEKRQRELLRKYRDLEAIARADVDELARLVTRPVAEAIKAELRGLVGEEAARER